ncbi:hypothetical protein K432DRAFT_364013 [Lepidopterella palustris CBS 459.81]|uniref:Uncharacterized protein n=1 Tax=Lepidopterella palustris CBS 459.81 TaxID=1314670 RepID=A0A8E2J9B7_9PEZI|nr:hypothetical protein K432DRAFT_364013 [Lepidopterella palustris CBS 459.81]
MSNFSSMHTLDEELEAEDLEGEEGDKTLLPDKCEFSNLFGFETSVAELERNSWVFPSKLKLTSLDRNKCLQFISDNRVKNVRPPDRSFDQETRSPISKLLYVSWQTVSHASENGSPLSLPSTRTVLALAKEHNWVTSEYLNLYQNASGGSAALIAGEPNGFILQTPNDGGPFCSLCLLNNPNWAISSFSSKGLYLADSLLDFKHLIASIPDARDQADCNPVRNLGLMILPVRILEEQVVYTRDELMKLLQRLVEVEKRIASGHLPPNAEDNRILNALSLEHIRLHRRWSFTLELGRNILRYYEASLLLPTSKALGEEVQMQMRFSEQSRYDFENLPRRIRNQSKAIFSLIAQRDNQLNIEISQSMKKLAEESRKDNQLNIQIAKSSARIAEESRRDSASMKTIAVLTLVFLPGTSIASIFSMTMFNWNATAGQAVASKWLWIYFVITIPLTLLILLGWLWWFRRSQRTHQNRWKDVEASLEFTDTVGLHPSGKGTPVGSVRVR